MGNTPTGPLIVLGGILVFWATNRALDRLLLQEGEVTPQRRPSRFNRRQR